MYRALRRAGWALAAAAGLGIVAPARTPAAPPAPVYQEITEVGPEAMSPVIVQDHVLAAPDAHLAAIEVELAWLADPLTCPYHLTLHIEGGSAHVRGYVQNKAAREKALRLAREHCMLQVVDELKIHASMVISVMAPAEPLKPSEAEATLKEAFSAPANAFHVTCKPDGRVRVTGTVTNLDDKLAVSRRLRTLPGCMAVVNELQFPAMAMARTAQQRHKAPHQMSPLEAQAMPVGPPVTKMTPAPEQPAEPWVPVTQAPAAVTQAPVPDAVTPAPRAPAAAATAPAAETPSGPMIPNAGLLTQLQNRVEQICGKAATDIHLVPKSRRDLLIQLTVRDDDTAARLSEKILTLPELAGYHVDLDVNVPDLDPTAPRTSPAAATSLAPPPPVPALPRATVTPATGSTARPAVSVPAAHPPAVVSQAPRPPGESRAPATSVLAGPPPAPVYPVAMENVKEPMPPMPAPALPDFPRPPTRASVLPGAANAPGPLAIKKDSPTPKKIEPVESVVYLKPESGKAEPKAPAHPASLKECIERTCGRTAGEVHVQLVSPHNVLVQFKVPGEREGERLAAKVLAMPELAAYHVDLDVSVADEPVPPPPLTAVAWHPVTAPDLPAKSAFGPDVPAAAAAVPRAPQRAVEANKESPGYASTGVVILSEPTPTVGRSPSSPLPAGLQERLQQACGKRAEVRAVARSATQLRLDLKAHTATEAERLTNVLLNLPELRPFKVDVDVTLIP